MTGDAASSLYESSVNLIVWCFRTLTNKETSEN